MRFSRLFSTFRSIQDPGLLVHSLETDLWGCKRHHSSSSPIDIMYFTLALQISCLEYRMQQKQSLKYILLLFLLGLFWKIYLFWSGFNPGIVFSCLCFEMITYHNLMMINLPLFYAKNLAEWKMIKCIQEVSKQLINQNPEMRGIKNSIKAGSQKQQHFWLRQELKVSQCASVRSAQTCLKH